MKSCRQVNPIDAAAQVDTHWDQIDRLLRGALHCLFGAAGLGRDVEMCHRSQSCAQADAARFGLLSICGHVKANAIIVHG